MTLVPKDHLPHPITAPLVPTVDTVQNDEYSKADDPTLAVDVLAQLTSVYVAAAVPVLANTVVIVSPDAPGAAIVPRNDTSNIVPFVMKLGGRIVTLPG